MDFGAAVTWLNTPIDPSRVHMVAGMVSWHARLMVLAWAILIPVGILFARYFKVTPGQNWPHQLDNRTWWYFHLSLQWSAAAIAVFALALIVYETGQVSFTADPHHFFGWLTLLLMFVQIVAGMYRGSKGGPTYPAPDGSWRGDHYDMTLRRKIFEYTHKSLGYVALVSSVAAILFGLWVANAPIWMWGILCLWWLILIIVSIGLQRRYRAIDTYQAIWGPDPRLPGNKIKPIGFRVYRPAANND